MTIYSFTFRKDHLDQIESALLRDDGCEHAAYVLCNKAFLVIDPWARQAHEKFLSAKVIPVPDDDVIESGPDRVTWRTRSFAHILKEAEANNQTVAIIHNHPMGLIGFSAQDDANEPDLLQMAINRNGEGTRILSFVLTGDRQLAGRVWLHPTKNGHQPISMIRVIGSEIVLHYPDRGHRTPLDAFHRQALAFGEALNQDLRKLRIGIVGCGGTGSAVAMVLARLGVGQLALFDNDIVDQTNLNRLHGARQADADAMCPKVDVVAQSITEMGLGVRVVPINAWGGDPKCRDALRACDVVFGCTDDHDGRLFLNRLAYYYLIPVIDLGLAIDVGDQAPPVVKALDGRVTVLGPHHTCLLCRGVIDPEIARSESMKRTNPAEYEKRKTESYVVGEGNPSPAVVTFTTEVACMAVNEFIHRLQGFRGPGGAASNRVRKFHIDIDRRPSHKPGSACMICGEETIWGQRDIEPFMGRIN